MRTNQFRYTLLGIIGLLAASIGVARGDGTVQFATGPLTNPRYCSGALAPPGSFYFGIFIVSTDGSETLVYPLGTNTATGSIGAPNPYPIPGTAAGETVSLRVRAWAAQFGTNWPAAISSGYAETPVRQITLGPETGPAAIIWQGAAGTNPDRFFPLQFCPLAGPKFMVAYSRTITEGTNGAVDVTFTVNLEYGSDYPTNYPKLVAFSTRSGTALAGEDFIPINGTLSFARGETSKAVTVHLTPDAVPEPDEQFFFQLSDPIYAGFINSSTACTITEARVIDARLEGANVAVTFHTVAGRRYALEFTADWSGWSVVPGAENITGVGGPMTVEDNGAAQNTPRFYRLRLLAP